MFLIDFRSSAPLTQVSGALRLPPQGPGADPGARRRDATATGAEAHVLGPGRHLPWCPVAGSAQVTVDPALEHPSRVQPQITLGKEANMMLKHVQ